MPARLLLVAVTSRAFNQKHAPGDRMTVPLWVLWRSGCCGCELFAATVI